MELTELPHNTFLWHDYTANLQLISCPLDIRRRREQDANRDEALENRKRATFTLASAEAQS